jgi:geranylgeranyl reductase family protein
LGDEKLSSQRLKQEEKLVYDLIVVGAGPAGSSAARAAAREGLQVLILEKESFPRYKPCGGAFSEKARSLLEFEIPKEICERVITGARVHYRDRAIEIHKGYPLSTLVTRSRFDAFLLQQALGAGALLEVEKAMAYEEKEGCVIVKGEKKSYTSRFLVVSSGCQDGLGKGIGSEGARPRGLCLVTEVEANDEEIERHPHNTLDIHFGVAPRGYGWVFPHRGYYSVGIGGLMGCFSHPRKAMLEFLRGQGFAEEQRIHGHLLPFGDGRRRIASKRVLLAGDSAGFVDAFTGEGICYALRSGQIAGKTVAEGLYDGYDAASVYQARCWADFGEELRYAYILARIMHSRPELFFPILISQREALDKFLGIAAAKTSYKEFLRWLVPRLPSRALRALWRAGIKNIR